jgi:hypothetical protein
VTEEYLYDDKMLILVVYEIKITKMAYMFHRVDPLDIVVRPTGR